MSRMFKTKGFVYAPSKMAVSPAVMTVITTNDKHGRSLSIACELLDIQMQIPFDGEIAKSLDMRESNDGTND